MLKVGKYSMYSLAHGWFRHIPTWVAWNTLNHQHVTTAEKTMETNGSPFAFKSSEKESFGTRKDNYMFDYNYSLNWCWQKVVNWWKIWNAKAMKYIICVFAHAHVTYVSLKYLRSLMSLSKSNSGFYFLNCIQEFIQIDTLSS